MCFIWTNTALVIMLHIGIRISFDSSATSENRLYIIQWWLAEQEDADAMNFINESSHFMPSNLEELGKHVYIQPNSLPYTSCPSTLYRKDEGSMYTCLPSSSILLGIKWLDSLIKFMASASSCSASLWWTSCSVCCTSMLNMVWLTILFVKGF